MNTFVLDKYKDRHACMLCENIQEAKNFCEFLHSAGRVWNSGQSYIDPEAFSYLAFENIVMFFNEGLHGILSSKNKSYLKYSDFDEFIIDDYDSDIEVPEEDEENFNNFISTFMR